MSAGAALYAAGSATRARTGARSDVAGMLDQALMGGRLARGRTGGESDGMRAGGTLDPDSRAGRRLRLAGWIVGPDHPAAMSPDQVAEAMRAAGLIGHGAGVDDAVDEYARLALVAERQGSATAQRAQDRAEQAWWSEREAEAAAQPLERAHTVHTDDERARVRDALYAWCERLVHGPKRDYAWDLVAAWDGGPEAVDPGTAWAPKTRARMAWIIRTAARS